jgi:uncharacterized membrane protein YedE/YeeE
MDEIPVTTLVALLGFAGGAVLGATARSVQFCTLGAIADAFLTDNHRRLRGWVLAMATAILLSQGLHMAGAIDLRDSIYLVPDFGWLGAILGGLCFGFGMALAGTCGYGTLVRLGGGDLRSLVDFVVLGIVAYATLRGLTGLGRVLFIEPTNADLSAIGGQGLVALAVWLTGAGEAVLRPLLVGLVVVAMVFYCFNDSGFRRSRRDIFGGVVIGGVVTFGWLATGVLAADEFDPAPLESFTFVAPLGESLVYVMTYTGSVINFGIGSVGGVIVGAFLASRARGDFRLEAFDDPKEMIRHLAGAALMGFGGVAALGCTIGQGVTGMSTLSLGAPLALAAIFLGAYLGLKYLVEGSLRAVFRSGFARY